VPEAVGVGALLVLGLASSAWAIRRLGLPLWWLAFPPLVDGMWNANPHVLVMPLIVAGLVPVAIVVKLYGAVVPVVRGEIRVLAVTALILAVTAPILPWATFLRDLPIITTNFRLTSGGGLSVWSFDLPVLAVALLAAGLAFLVVVSVDRDRAAWIAMPVFWPYTQWYYSSIAIPGVSGSGPWLLGAAILAIPLSGGPVVALIVCAVGVLMTTRRTAAPAEFDPP
jgi:hypothetical protein